MKSFKKQEREADECSDDLDYEKDFEKLKTLWMEARKAKVGNPDENSTKRFDKKKNEPQEQSEQEEYVRLLQEKNQILKEQLDRALRDKEELIRRVRMASPSIRRGDRGSEREESQSLLQEKGASVRFNGNATAIMNASEQIAKFSDQVAQLQKEINNKNEEITNLKLSLTMRKEDANVAKVAQDKNWDKAWNLEKQVESRDLVIRNLEAKIREMQRENDDLLFSKKTESTTLVEMEHLRADVKRLVKMLRTTKEFKDFADFSDDSGRSIRFLKSINQVTPTDVCSCFCKGKLKDCEEQKIIDEKLVWVPEEAFQYAHQFRLKYKGELTDTLIEDLLFELNKLWSRREEARLRRVKTSCSHESNALRRQLDINPKYDEHQAKQTIARLKNQLKLAYKENREAFAQRQGRNPPGIHYINETMKVNKELQKSKKVLNNENYLLRSKLDSMEKHKFEDNKEKILFMEGATWMGNRVLKAYESLNSGFEDLVKEELLKSEGVSTEKSSSNRVQFKDSAKHKISEFGEFLNEITKDSEKRMIQAAEDIRKSNSLKKSYL